LIFLGKAAEEQILLPNSAGHRMKQNGTLALRAGHPTRSIVVAAERLAVAPVFVRMHPRTRIVNVWMILIVLVGAIITIADGMTRNFDLR